ncbi:hypothetical protein S40285_09560 [Stachybotrys chlorohalonatus IBT 40285]|uniref:Uncharacterized protein n=1 Tax=Stachybotrys chlorohalonatus (strain IBT 40285) TaxID=1283841 RepID=A0A084R132_STAC4|nr:hypothetical protein S40285_09560 [Stachybotrys chlorohalonata IBT 40285]
MAPPPPPGPPPPPKGGQAAPRSLPKPPIVAKQRPEGAFHLELIIYNGAPYKDHWAYFIQSSTNPNIGVVIHAIGDVRNGFSLECKRSYNIAVTRRRVTRISLAWIAGRHIDENAMLGKGLSNNILNVPVDEFERSAFKVLPPGKTLNAAEDRVSDTTTQRHRGRQDRRDIVDTSNGRIDISEYLN